MWSTCAMTVIIIMKIKIGFLKRPLKTLKSFPIDRALNSLNILENHTRVFMFKNKQYIEMGSVLYYALPGKKRKY